MASALPRLLHVANGTSTLDLIEAAGVPGRLSQWADPLHDGPVPGDLTDAELVAVRARFLAAGGLEAAIDPRNDLHRWRQVILDHEAYDELVLWYEHDLFDQLNLVQVLTFIRQHVPATHVVSLICIDRFPGRVGFKGLVNSRRWT